MYKFVILDDFMFRKIIKVVLIFLIWGFFVFGCASIYKIYKADVYFKKSQELLKKQKILLAQEYSEKAIELNPAEPAYYWGLSKVLVVSLVENFDSTTKQNIIRNINISENLNSKNLVSKRNFIAIVYFLAVEDLNIAPGESNLDLEYLDFIKSYYKNSKTTYSKDLGVLVDIAKYEKRLGLEEDYFETVTKVESLRPEVLDWHESFR